MINNCTLITVMQHMIIDKIWIENYCQRNIKLDIHTLSFKLTDKFSKVGTK